MTNLIDHTVNRYHILERLGEGGMAEVYKAVDLNLDREVAIKFLRIDPKNFEKSRKRFELEAKALAKFDHPNIVRVLDYGDYEDRPYLVLEYIPGGNLKQHLGKPMPWKQACTLLIPIAEALQYAHDRKIIHRDVKPSNILLKVDGTPMLSDFGVAKMLEMDETLDLTGTSIGVGTPYYMAPEQGQGSNVDHRVDIYALGIVLYELITGRKPFQADTPMAVMLQHIEDPLPRPSKLVKGLPALVERILFKVLAKDPDQRLSSMSAFAEALRKVTEKKGERGSRNKVAYLMAGAVFIILAMLIVWQSGFVNLKDLPFLGEMGINKNPPLVTQTLGLLDETPEHQITDEKNVQETRISETREAQETNSTIPTVVEYTPISTSEVYEAGFIKQNPEDKADIVYIPAGAFTMGLTPDQLQYLQKNFEDCYSDFEVSIPSHDVFLDGYWIYKTEVTMGMYKTCIKDGNCTPPRYYSWDWNDRNHEGYPANLIDWNQADTYCKWAGGRLPTEAEWEKAARDTDGRLFPWGSSPPSVETVNRVIYDWGGGRSNEGGQPDVLVDSYIAGASPYGLLHMAGNADEWVADWFSPIYYQELPYMNPIGPDNTSNEFNQKVVRGGTNGFELGCLCSALHRGMEISTQDEDIGFRCVIDNPSME